MNIVCKLVFLAGLMAVSGASANKWTLVHSQGFMNFVFMDPSSAKDQDQYRYAIADICKTKPICQVKFWTNRANTPAKLPMTDKQLDTMVAYWMYNSNTGLRKLEWSCKISKEPDCF